MEIDKAYLLRHCAENNLYRSPQLNDKLFLHYKYGGLSGGRDRGGALVLVRD